MSNIRVDIGPLTERYRKGLSAKQGVMDDIKALREDAGKLAALLRENGRDSEAYSLEEKAEEIYQTAVSITDVCEYDSFAVRRYGEMINKMNEIVSAIDI